MAKKHKPAPARKAIRQVDGQREAQYQDVARQLAEGATRLEMVRYGAEKLNLGERTIDKFLARFREEMQKSFEKELPTLRSEITRRLWLIHDLALKGKIQKTKEGDLRIFLADLGEARLALGDIAKLVGLLKSTVVIEEEREYADESDEDIRRAAR